jgi:hypothetical protein
MNGTAMVSLPWQSQRALINGIEEKDISLQIVEVKQTDDEINLKEKCFHFRLYIRYKFVSLNCVTLA